jgi:predicted nucleotidyltransferase
LINKKLKHYYLIQRGYFLAFDIETVSLIVAKYANEVRNILPVGKVILFCSFAKGTANEYSDVDVCFF